MSVADTPSVMADFESCAAEEFLVGFDAVSGVDILISVPGCSNFISASFNDIVG
jgi:hypothetical protein